MHRKAVWMTKVLHGVAQNEGLQDERMREGFIPSGAPEGKKA